MKKMNVSVIIPAGGIGTRMNTELPKQFIELNNIPIIIKTIKLFDTIEEVKTIIIPTHISWISYMSDLANKFNCIKIKDIIVGGKERQDSVYMGLQSKLIKDSDVILIHDAVRPFTSSKLICQLIETANDCGAVIPIINSVDSIKQIDKMGNVLGTFDREYIGLVQTPEAYKTSIVMEAYKKASATKYYGTDTSSLVEFAGYKVQYIKGERSNIKVTSPIDLEMATILSDGG